MREELLREPETAHLLFMRGGRPLVHVRSSSIRVRRPNAQAQLMFGADRGGLDDPPSAGVVDPGRPAQLVQAGAERGHMAQLLLEGRAIERLDQVVEGAGAQRRPDHPRVPGRRDEQGVRAGA
ncbi:hypothetical protein SCYAM73S_00255 [Streptomyces cyaneofuscatus]